MAGVVILVCSACASTGQTSSNTPQALPGEEPRPLLSEPSAKPESIPDPGPAVASAPELPANTCEMFTKPGILKRSALVRLLDGGLPRWLQGVEGDRALANHRFQGWLVKSLHPGDPCYKEVDLRPGDVVQKVNGKSIEKPEQAFDVAESLRSAPALVVDYLRDGRTGRLSIAIADDTAPSKN
jgi:S1-C subfamily serine protease